MGAVLTNDHVNDLARWAFGPEASARHLAHEDRQHRCEIRLGMWMQEANASYTEQFAIYAPTWAEAFAKAGWPFPPPPRKTYIALGQSILIANGDATEQVATARSITMATRIAKALNRA